jgi:hypothetical protein
MKNVDDLDQTPIRDAMKEFPDWSNVSPNDEIKLEQVFFPYSHRGILDVERPLVVGNRGMGKSFWTHALKSADVRSRLSKGLLIPTLRQTHVAIGFNASMQLKDSVSTTDLIRGAFESVEDPKTIWRAVILSAVKSMRGAPQSFQDSLGQIAANPHVYAEHLAEAESANSEKGSTFLILFDALDRLAGDWEAIRKLTKALLNATLELQSFRNIRAKVFMRVDQYGDHELFRFPDSSKIRNTSVKLEWLPHELYGLLFFELMRDESARAVLTVLADRIGAKRALPVDGRIAEVSLDDQKLLVAAIAGEYMGKDMKRGRVYNWVPLHLGDAQKNCSPRTFLTAWKAAAEHVPAPQVQAVDHLGINAGVRSASDARLDELREDYQWIPLVLEPLKRQFVPISRPELYELWNRNDVMQGILRQGGEKPEWMPIGMFERRDLDGLLKTMTDIAVMEVRDNGKINVPDIFRVAAGILRKGGVSVPRKKSS